MRADDRSFLVGVAEAQGELPFGVAQFVRTGSGFRQPLLSGRFRAGGLGLEINADALQASLQFSETRKL